MSVLSFLEWQPWYFHFCLMTVSMTIISLSPNTNMKCLSSLIQSAKRRARKITIPSKHISSKYDGFVGGKSLYEKLWEHLGKREKLELKSTKFFAPGWDWNCISLSSSTSYHLQRASYYSFWSCQSILYYSSPCKSLKFEAGLSNLLEFVKYLQLNKISKIIHYEPKVVYTIYISFYL